MTDPGTAHATSTPTGHSVEGQCADLLQGIALDSESRAAVLAIVAADSAARRELVVHHPHRFWDQIAMIAARDASIRALLPTEMQKRQLDVNVERWNKIRRGE